MTVPFSHSDRDHATWSASATARNWTCAGALAMATLSPDDKESIHAARGTAAHTISERALRVFLDAPKDFPGFDCGVYLGDMIKTKEFEIEVDEELVASAQSYVNYVYTAALDPGRTLLLEKKFSLDPLDPPFEAGGTCDAIVLKPDIREIEVVDLKNGMGLVEVTENKQTRTYALLALLNLEQPALETVETIKVTIVQPRAPHRDGRIRSESFHLADLMDWTAELMQAMARSKEAFDAFQAIGGNRVKFDEWAEKYLTPGSCKFCPAEGICPKLRRSALKVAPASVAHWLEDFDAPKPDLSNMPALQSPEQRGRVLDGLEMLEDWIKAVRSFEHREAEKGNPATGYQLSDKIGNRAWTGDEEYVVSALRALKLTDAQIYARKLASPAQIDKVLGAKRKDEIKNLWENPVKGTNLVSTAKTSRPPAKSVVEQFLEKDQ